MPRAIDLSSNHLFIHEDKTAAAAAVLSGPPPVIDGYTVGLVVLERNPPHAGERHLDGDEILYLISGRAKLICDTQPPLELTAGQACIVPQGEWHRVEVIETASVLFITPGPNNQVRHSQDC